MEAEAFSEGTLRSYLRILVKRKWSVLLVVALTLAGAIGYSRIQHSVYEATAQLILEPTPTEQLLGGGNSFLFQAPSVPDEIQRMEGNGVSAIVQQKLGSVPGISASQLGTTDVMLVTATAGTARQAARVANTYADAYLTFSRNRAIDNLNASNQIIQSQIQSVQSQINSTQTQLANAPNAGGSGSQSSTGTLNAELSSLYQQIGLLNQQANTLSLAASLGPVSAQIISNATPPSTPVSPNLKKDILLGLVTGIILGIGFVIFREFFDDTMRSEEEVHYSLIRTEATAHNLVLGSIPVGFRDIPGEKPVVASLADPTSPQAEAYRELRTSLQFIRVRAPLRAVLVTSPIGGEGKTTTVSNLAVMLAHTGKSTVMLSLDLRRPKLHECFGLPNDIGFTSVVVGQSSLEDALLTVERPVEGAGELALLSAGPLPPNPSEILASEAAIEIIESLKDRYDVVLIDSPPVLRVTDAAVISTVSDTTLLIVRPGMTTRRAMMKSLDTLGRVSTTMTSVVVNALPTELTYKHRYLYSSYEATRNGTAGVSSNGHHKLFSRHHELTGESQPSE